MNDSPDMTDGTAEALSNLLGPRVEIEGIGEETDIEKINEIVFELYKEAASVACVAAHVIEDRASANGGWPRNQAVCAGLIVRITKFMLVVVQLSATRNRGDVVMALNRSIMESVINLEFLVRTNDDKFADQFVKFSLGPERELYDVIEANVAARGGEVLPIEERMLKSIGRICQASGVKIEEVNRKHGDWGGGLRERLKALKKEELYLFMQRLPSHAVHGSWVDLCQHHLNYIPEKDVFQPDTDFSNVDARLPGPIAFHVLDATKPYLERFFATIAETNVLSERIDDLATRIVKADEAHEKLMAAKK